MCLTSIVRVVSQHVEFLSLMHFDVARQWESYASMPNLFLSAKTFQLTHHAPHTVVRRLLKNGNA